MRRTTLPDAAVVEATDIWEALFGSRLEAVAPAPASSSADLTGSIQISGAWEGVVVLGASRLIAQRLAGLRLEMAEPADADICDVIGELANLIAGAVQALLPVPSDLSLPSVVAGKDYRLIFPRCSIVNEVHLSFCAEPISLMVVKANHDRYAQRTPELGCSLMD